MMHHYEDSDLDRENLDYFLLNGVNQHSDFYFNVVGDVRSEFPTLPNVQVIESKNRDMDYGGI